MGIAKFATVGRRAAWVLVAVSVVGCGSLPDESEEFGSVEHAAVSTNECTVRGNGALPSGVRFAGMARGNGSGSVAGHWRYGTGPEMVSVDPDLVLCKINGELIAGIEGSARVGSVSGLSAIIHLADTEGDPGTDFFSITVKDPSDVVVFDAEGELTSGDIVITSPEF